MGRELISLTLMKHRSNIRPVIGTCNIGVRAVAVKGRMGKKLKLIFFYLRVLLGDTFPVEMVLTEKTKPWWL